MDGNNYTEGQEQKFKFLIVMNKYNSTNKVNDMFLFYFKGSIPLVPEGNVILFQD